MSNDNGNYIKLNRKLLSWGWFKNGDMLKLWVYLLLTAKYEDTYDDGVFLKRGQVKFGRKKASYDLGISEQSIRTCISRLKHTNEITIKSTNKYTIITILKYEEYQGKRIKSTNKITNKLTNNQPTTNQQLTTYKKEKKERNKEIYDVIKIKSLKERWLEAGYTQEQVDSVGREIKYHKLSCDENTFTKLMNVITNDEISNSSAYIHSLVKRGEL